jgi:hypothetical protein
VYVLLLQAMQVTSFGDDLRNGLVLGALLAAHWPGDDVMERHMCSALFKLVGPA